MKKKVLGYIGIFMMLCLCACGGKTDNVEEITSESTVREVSSQFRGFALEYRLDKSGFKESGMVYEDAPIAFQDMVMEEMLRNIISKPEGEVYISDLQGIHTLSFNIGEWSPASYRSNLQEPEESFLIELDEAGNHIQPKSLADLAYCYNLQKIYFGGIEIPSVEPLYDLPQLEFLSLAGGGVTEEVLEEIGHMPVLKVLEIGIGEFTHLGDLTDGSFLLPIADQLVFLEACGDIDWNPQVLAQMTNLKALDIEKAPDLSFLEYMTNLEELWMYCPEVSDWSPLAFAQNLEYLKVGGNDRVTVEVDLEDLVPLKKLDYLSLTYTTINTEHSYQEVVDALPSLTQFNVY